MYWDKDEIERDEKESKKRSTRSFTRKSNQKKRLRSSSQNSIPKSTSFRLNQNLPSNRNKKRFISVERSLYPDTKLRSEKSTGSQRVFFRTIQNSVREIKNKVKTDNTYNNTDTIFNSLFKPAAIFSSIIKKIKFSDDLKPLFYCEVNIKKTTLEPHDSYTQVWDKLLSADEKNDGHYFVRMVIHGGHSICIYKEGKNYIVYDSNDYTESQYLWHGTKILVNNIKNYDNENVIESGYQSHSIQPMEENICTMFALYAWIIGPVPERPARSKMNSKIAKQYLLSLLTDLKNKFFAYKDDIQMLQLYNLMEINIIANSQKYA